MSYKYQTIYEGKLWCFDLNLSWTYPTLALGLECQGYYKDLCLVQFLTSSYFHENLISLFPYFCLISQ